MWLIGGGRNKVESGIWPFQRDKKADINMVKGLLMKWFIHILMVINEISRNFK
jgi:hypothetical protein